MVQHTIDPRRVNVEKLKQLDVLVVLELRPLLEHEEDEVVNPLYDSVDI